MAWGDLVRTISYEFDDSGRLLSASDPDSAYAYAYDALGRMNPNTAPSGGDFPALVPKV